MKKYLFLLPLFLFPAFGFFSPQPESDLTCPAPANVTITAQSDGGNIAFDWDDCGCSPTTYKVSYFRQGDQYQSPAYSAGGSNYSFSSLSEGTYDFSFYTVCGSERSEIIVINDINVE